MGKKYMLDCSAFLLANTDCTIDKHMPGVAVGKLADSPNYSLNLGNRLPLLLYGTN